MLNIKTKAEIDQAFAFIAECYPPLWRNLYKELVEQGFTEQQSFKLLETYIIASSSGE